MQAARRRPKAVVFDLDTAVIDRRRAWAYAIEEAVLTVTGRRVLAANLYEAYHTRPWLQALAIIVPEGDVLGRCEELCNRFFFRSAMKRLTVFDGIAMALDELRGDAVAMGGITRERHPNAMRQIESTGIDRFLTVLSPTAAGSGWNAAARFLECSTYLEAKPQDLLFVTGEPRDAAQVGTTGAPCAIAGWAPGDHGMGALEHPSAVCRAIADHHQGKPSLPSRAVLPYGNQGRR